LLAPAAAIALSAAVALSAAACSGTTSGRQVAGLPGHAGNGGSPGTLTTAQADRDMVNFARCMRAHGVQVPDPFHRPGHTGLSIGLPTQTAANRPAFTACNHFLQPIVNMKMAAGAAQAAPHLAALTRYAQCMRAHDISMLDPNSQGALNLGPVPGMNSDFGRYSPQFRAADAACRHLLPAGVNDNGTGP
jgi:hypothetical protein